MSNVLLIVEGEQEEKEFFEHFNHVKDTSSFSVFPFCQNILYLHEICKEYIFGDIKPDNIIDILKEQLTNISKEDLEKLNHKYTDVFLIFDLDLQNHKSRLMGVDDYLKKVLDLIEFFDDSTTIGKILVNYPMMESFMHIDDPNGESFKDFTIPYEIAEDGSYTNYLHTFQMNFPVHLLNNDDYKILSAYNLKKANYIINGDYSAPTSEQYEYDLTQKNIFIKQVEQLRKGRLYTLNCSTFVDVELRGQSVYFNENNSSIYSARNEFIKNHYKKLNKFKE